MDFAVCSRAADGETECGDLHLVKAMPDGLLLAVVDGAGHGPGAAGAARRAVATLEAHAGEGVIALMRRCHERLKSTRGAVISLLRFFRPADTFTWLGVGNIEGLLLRRTPSVEEPMRLRPGMVGYRLPPLQAAVVPIAPGDMLILATDGIRGNFTRGITAAEAPERIAERITSGFRSGNDDSLVLVARYRGWKA